MENVDILEDYEIAGNDQELVDLATPIIGQYCVEGDEETYSETYDFNTIQ